MRRVITLLSDFGGRGPYVGAMRAELVRGAPGARLVDITHDVPPHDVTAGAVTLAAAAPRFPRGSVHLAVVDPGVGSARRALVVEAGGHAFVGPDNGLLVAAASRLGEPVAREIDAARLGLAAPHPTFHGRDLFAPVAARVAAGASASAIGPVVREPVPSAIPPPSREPDGALVLRVLLVDDFGNVVTNLPVATHALPGVGAPWLLVAGGATHEVVRAETYAGIPPGRVALIAGSSGWEELSVESASAAARLGLAPGDTLVIRVTTPG